MEARSRLASSARSLAACEILLGPLLRVCYMALLLAVGKWRWKGEVPQRLPKVAA